MEAPQKHLSSKCPPYRLVFCNALMMTVRKVTKVMRKLNLEPLLQSSCYVFVSLNVMLEHAIGALVTGLCPLSCPVAGNACGDVFR